MNALDYLVLLTATLSIAAYGVWRTRGRRTLHSYLKGSGQTHWLVIGLSVMATQASAITFLSTPGQGYESGLGFVQNYFGAPFALILISAAFLPIYRRLNVYTAYEYLGQRFDPKTRLLAASLFLLQRGLGAGITIYAPAIVLSSVFGWRLDLTIIASGLVVIAYTVAGGSDAVSHTQKYQLAVIFAGMAAAFILLVHKIPASFTDSLALAGGFDKLNAVDFSPSPKPRYTLWSGLLGGGFLALSYFGTDQSQVQRYLTGSSLRESRLGLMFNALCKIPMQFAILLLGALLFVFYQFAPAPIFFNEPAWQTALARPDVGPELRDLQSRFDAEHESRQHFLHQWLAARHAGDTAAADAAREAARASEERAQFFRNTAAETLRQSTGRTQANDADYVFVSFILHHLPHGLIGLLVAAFFAATLSSKAAELNALASTTTVDVYRHLLRTAAPDAHYVAATRCFTALWGLAAIAFALFANLVENLIQAVNIIGSIFYGVVLGLFLTAFLLPRVRGTPAFYGALLAQSLVFILYFTLPISYLWYNLIGCAACMLFCILLQLMIGGPRDPQGFPVVLAES